MTSDELFFFNSMPDALPLYAALSEKLLAAFPNVAVAVKKTQITFLEKYGFAFVSLRRMKGCPKVFIIVSFGLSHRLDSPRIAVAVEPYPNRWTHHIIVQRVEELDSELMGWLAEAHAFALVK